MLGTSFIPKLMNELQEYQKREVEEVTAVKAFAKTNLGENLAWVFHFHNLNILEWKKLTPAEQAYYLEMDISTYKKAISALAAMIK